MKKKAFQLYSDYRGMVDALSDEDAGQLFKAVFAHEDGEDAALEGALRGIFVLLSNQLDRDRARYEEACAANQAKAQKRWNNTASDGMPAHAGACQTVPEHPDKDTDTETDTEKDTDTEGLSLCGAAPRTHTSSPPSRFKRPSLDEVKAYCAERKNSVDAQRFVDFYESKGWMVGKSPMRDWRAAVRGWEQDGRASPGKDEYVPKEQYRFGR
jgi:hypothetical protein